MYEDFLSVFKIRIFSRKENLNSKLDCEFDTDKSTDINQMLFDLQWQKENS